MLKEIFRRATLITEINAKLGTIAYKDIYITDKENIHPGAFDELFMSAGEFIIQKGQKIFFFPGCTAPRFKVRQLCQKEDMAIVRTPDKATVAVIGDDTSNELARPYYTHNGTFSKEEILGILEYQGNKTMNMVGFMERLKQPDIADEIIAPDYSTRTFFRDTLSCTGYSESYWTSEANTLEYFDSVMDLQVPFITQASLIRHLSQGTVMTEERYEEITNMLKSTDANNKSLAMEVMANCDYEKSAMYLLMLFRNHAYDLGQRKEKNHVNFQSLCKFFGLTPGYGFTLDDMLKIMKDRKLLNSANKEAIMKLALVEKGMQEEEEEDDEDKDPVWFKYELKPSDEMEEAILEGDNYMKLREEPTLDLNSPESEIKTEEVYD